MTAMKCCNLKHTMEKEKRFSILSECAWQLWCTGQLTDVVLLSDGPEFSVHRLVLAAYSQVLFSTLVSSDTTTQGITTINMSQYGISGETLDILLTFIYTGNLPTMPIDSNQRAALLQAASILQIPSLLSSLRPSVEMVQVKAEPLVHEGNYATQPSVEKVEVKAEPIEGNYTTHKPDRSYAELLQAAPSSGTTGRGRKRPLTASSTTKQGFDLKKRAKQETETVSVVNTPMACTTQEGIKKKKVSDTDVEIAQNAQSKRDRKTLFIKNLPSSVTEDQIKSLSPDIIHVSLRFSNKRKAKNLGDGYAFLEFIDESTVDKNYKSLKSKMIGDSGLIVDYVGVKSGRKGQKNRISPDDLDPLKLYVTGFSNKITVVDLKKKFPTASKITLPFKKKNSRLLRYAFIHFEEETTCRAAFDGSQGKELRGNKLTVVYGKKTVQHQTEHEKELM